jgi:hypothetical protein
MSYCTNMCTLATATVPFSAQMCVLWPLQPYLSVHECVYSGHFDPTFQCTNVCTLATSTLPFSARMCVLRPLKVNSSLSGQLTEYSLLSVLRSAPQSSVTDPAESRLCSTADRRTPPYGPTVLRTLRHCNRLSVRSLNSAILSKRKGVKHPSLPSFRTKWG